MNREEIRGRLLSASYEVLRLKAELKVREAERQYLQGAFDALSPLPPMSINGVEPAAPVTQPEELE